MVQQMAIYDRGYEIMVGALSFMSEYMELIFSTGRRSGYFPFRETGV